MSVLATTLTAGPGPAVLAADTMDERASAGITALAPAVGVAQPLRDAVAALSGGVEAMAMAAGERLQDLQSRAADAVAGMEGGVGAHGTMFKLSKDVGMDLAFGGKDGIQAAQAAEAIASVLLSGAPPERDVAESLLASKLTIMLGGAPLTFEIPEDVRAPFLELSEAARIVAKSSGRPDLGALYPHLAKLFIVLGLNAGGSGPLGMAKMVPLDLLQQGIESVLSPETIKNGILGTHALPILDAVKAAAKAKPGEEMDAVKKSIAGSAAIMGDAIQKQITFYVVVIGGLLLLAVIALSFGVVLAGSYVSCRRI